MRFTSPAAFTLALSTTVAALTGCTTHGGPRDAGPLIPIDGGGGGIDGGRDAGPGVDGGGPRDGGPVDAPVTLDPDAACASTSAEVVVERLPVDVIWVVDNSSSMRPAIEAVRDGMNAFAAQLASSGLDYRMVLLSLRGTTASGTLYPICVPEPLAGPGCADGPRFRHVSVNIRSTQPLEQILGTLGQTEQYRSGQTYGAEAGEPTWHDFLRPGATKTIVVVTDDNARMVTTSFTAPPSGDSDPTASPVATADLFEHFPGGRNPFNGSPTNTRALPAGILEPVWTSAFDGYTFDAIYGWGSETDPTVLCTYAGGATPPASGRSYTELVTRTGGVRAQICDGPAEWTTFFGSVATGVVRSSRIACDLALPPPPDGSVLDPRRVNVQIRGASGTTTLPYTGSESACDPTRGGWHYDDATTPTRVILCPSSCDFARTETATTSGGLDVVFGCASILI